MITPLDVRQRAQQLLADAEAGRRKISPPRWTLRPYNWWRRNSRTRLPRSSENLCHFFWTPFRIVGVWSRKQIERIPVIEVVVIGLLLMMFVIGVGVITQSFWGAVGAIVGMYGMGGVIGSSGYVANNKNPLMPSISRTGAERLMLVAIWPVSLFTVSFAHLLRYVRVLRDAECYSSVWSERNKRADSERYLKRLLRLYPNALQAMYASEQLARRVSQGKSFEDWLHEGARQTHDIGSRGYYCSVDFVLSFTGLPFWEHSSTAFAYADMLQEEAASRRPRRLSKNTPPGRLRRAVSDTATLTLAYLLARKKGICPLIDVGEDPDATALK